MDWTEGCGLTCARRPAAVGSSPTAAGERPSSSVLPEERDCRASGQTVIAHPSFPHPRARVTETELPSALQAGAASSGAARCLRLLRGRASARDTFPSEKRLVPQRRLPPASGAGGNCHTVWVQGPAGQLGPALPLLPTPRGKRLK